MGRQAASKKKKKSASPPLLADESSSALPVVPRDKGGKFLPGVSGNPAGRPVGSQNRAHLLKQLIEDRLSEDLAKEAVELFEVAIKMAKAGDRSMLKFILGDMLKPVRQSESKGKTTATQVNVIIEDHTSKKVPSVIIDQQPIEVQQ